jgi:hypothetical protein
MAACRKRNGVLARETSGRTDPMLGSEDRHVPIIGRYGMRQVRTIKQRRTADTGWGRRREPVLPLDPREPEITRAKRLRRCRG